MSIDDDCHRLMALLAHEMRSPGAVVAGYLRMLKGPSASVLPEREQKMIEEANRSCSRLLHIVQELSELGELSDAHLDLTLTPVPVFAICDDVVQDAGNDGADVTFICADGDRDVMIDGHADRLKQALAGLVASVVRERGSAPVEARAFVHRNAEARAVIAFGDPGMSANVSELLGEQKRPFDRWRGGMGLSLPIAHRIVEVHRGVLWGLPGSRATCALSLPLASV
jgi:signal transduction histidine kinase